MNKNLHLLYFPAFIFPIIGLSESTVSNSVHVPNADKLSENKHIAYLPQASCVLHNAPSSRVGTHLPKLQYPPKKQSDDF
jgi:hypothetical protein